MDCYVLIGGRSQRMGEPKIALPFAGTTFLGHVVAVAAEVFAHVIAVQRPDGEPVRGVETIFESPHEWEAPIFGVHRALQHAGARCFVVAVDYPLIRADVLRFLQERFEQSRSSMLVPVWNGVPQVLCAGFSPGLMMSVELGIASRRFDLRSIAVGAETVAEDLLRSRFPGEPLMNVNTPEDLAEAQRIYERQGLLTSR